jgi:IS30 family transposase
VIAKVENKTADLVSAAIVNRLKQFGSKVKTLTFDNGKEFCGHAKIDGAFGSVSFFTRPFASWERCSNENFNGLLRQYVPKKRSMESITDEELK